jgi:arginine repressor
MNLKEIQARLTQETGVDVTIRTVQRYLRKLNLKLLPNDLSDGRITMEKVFEAINNARDCLLQHNTGYRRMRIILIRQYNIRIPRFVLFCNTAST